VGADLKVSCLERLAVVMGLMPRLNELS